METHIFVLMAVLIVLVAMSAYFSATETAFSSLNRIRVKNMADSGNKRAALVLSLSDNYDKLLSTILIGNNIVNITSASISTVVFVAFLADAGVTVSTVVMTVVVLIFGEISPKSMAKQNAERFAMFSAPLLRVFMVVFTPLNFLFMQWKKLLDRLFKSRSSAGMTGEELLTLVDEVQNEGTIDEEAGQLIRAAIEFDDLEVQDILTPRVQIKALDEDSTLEEVEALFVEQGFSRLPVYRGTIDTIVGILHEKELLPALRAGRPWQEAVREAVCVPPSMHISDLLRLLQQKKSHMALAVDEFGGTAGLVTMEDILEELVGDIWDESDEVEEDFRKVEEGAWEVSGSYRFEELADELDIKEEADAVTVSGWVMEELGAIPYAGDSFDYDNRLRVTVLSADNRCATRLLITLLKEPPRSDDPA